MVCELGQEDKRSKRERYVLLCDDCDRFPCNCKVLAEMPKERVKLGGKVAAVQFGPREEQQEEERKQKELIDIVAQSNTKALEKLSPAYTDEEVNYLESHGINLVRPGPASITVPAAWFIENQKKLADLPRAPLPKPEQTRRELPDRRQTTTGHEPDPWGVNHPKHYNLHPAGVECITIAEHYSFNCGSALKYLWRAGLKAPDKIQDLKKAKWYIDREIQRLEKFES